MTDNWFNEPRPPKEAKAKEDLTSRELWYWAFTAGGVSWIGEGLENALGTLEHLRRFGRQPVPEIRWAGKIQAPVRKYLDSYGINWREIDE